MVQQQRQQQQQRSGLPLGDVVVVACWMEASGTGTAACDHKQSTPSLRHPSSYCDPNDTTCDIVFGSRHPFIACSPVLHPHTLPARLFVSVRIKPSSTGAPHVMPCDSAMIPVEKVTGRRAVKWAVRQ